MAGSPIYKVYDAEGVYQGCAKHPSMAAAMIAMTSAPGQTIRFGHSFVVWREGSEEIEAGESFDQVAQTVFERVSAMQEKQYARTYSR
jgi:hypothetical protein